jgi:hypothetical protein
MDVSKYTKSNTLFIVPLHSLTQKQFHGQPPQKGGALALFSRYVAEDVTVTLPEEEIGTDG